MTNADDAYEDDYNEYDEFDDDDERGLSGLSVLVIGLVMIGAFISVVWIAYQQGLKRNANGLAAETPYVAAEPEPIKIETADSSAPVEDREVYDVFDGEEAEPATVLAEGPEEPVDRDAEDPIAAIAAGADENVDEETDARLASLAEEDAQLLGDAPVDQEPEPVAATTPTAASVTPAEESEPSGPVSVSAISGTHVVQVGAFRSDEEAQAQWARLQSRLGDYLNGKTYDIERADLGDRGVYHRLRMGPFDSSDAAKEYCAGLKERGQDCLSKSI